MLPNSFGRSTSAETDDSRMASPMQAIAISECQRRLRTAAAYDASSGRSWASGKWTTGEVTPRRRESALLLAKRVDELDQLDHAFVVLGVGRNELAVLAVRQPVEGGLVLGRRLLEGLPDRGLQVVRHVGEVGIGRVRDQIGLGDDPEVLLLGQALGDHAAEVRIILGVPPVGGDVDRL